MRRNLYDDGNTADGIFIANGTQGLSTHIWWAKREGGPIPRPLPSQWRRTFGMGGHELHDTETSKGTRAWSESNKLSQSVPPNPGVPTIC